MRISKHGIGRSKLRRTLKKISKLMEKDAAGKLTASGKRHLHNVARWTQEHEKRLYPELSRFVETKGESLAEQALFLENEKESALT